MKKQEIFRRTQFFPELAGFLNTQVKEQLYRTVTKDLYIFSLLLNSIYLMHPMLHACNERSNSHAIWETTRKTRMHVSIGELGRLVSTAGIMFRKSFMTDHEISTCICSCVTSTSDFSSYIIMSSRHSSNTCSSKAAQWHYMYTTNHDSTSDNFYQLTHIQGTLIYKHI